MKKATGADLQRGHARPRRKCAESRLDFQNSHAFHADVEHHDGHMVRAGVGKKVFQFI